MILFSWFLFILLFWTGGRTEELTHRTGCFFESPLWAIATAALLDITLCLVTVYLYLRPIRHVCLILKGADEFKRTIQLTTKAMLVSNASVLAGVFIFAFT